jgi:hypothetical protein
MRQSGFSVNTPSENADPSARPVAIIGATVLIALFRSLVRIIPTTAACAAAGLITATGRIKACI